MRKRILSVSIFIILALCFSACSKKEEKKTVSLDEFTMPAEVQTKSDSGVKEKKNKKTKDNISVENKNNSNDEEKDNKSLSYKGEVDGNTYKNKAFGIKFEEPEDYTLYSKEQYINRTQSYADAMTSDFVASSMESTYDYIEMVATHYRGAPDLQVLLEEVDEDISEKEYVDNTGLGTVMYDIEGFEMNVKYDGEEKIAGKKFYSYKIDFSYGEYKLCEKMYLKKKDNYMLLIITAYYKEDEKYEKQLIKAFKSYK